MTPQQQEFIRDLAQVLKKHKVCLYGTDDGVLYGFGEPWENDRFALGYECPGPVMQHLLAQINEVPPTL